MFMTNAEFNGQSSGIDSSGLLYSELKIFLKLQLSIIYTHMVDFCRPAHIWNSNSLLVESLSHQDCNSNFYQGCCGVGYDIA